GRRHQDPEPGAGRREGVRGRLDVPEPGWRPGRARHLRGLRPAQRGDGGAGAGQDPADPHRAAHGRPGEGAGPVGWHSHPSATYGGKAGRGVEPLLVRIVEDGDSFLLAAERVLTAKLLPPRPRRHTLVRQRLQERLREVWEVPLTIIQAGPGYGKTTALASFLAEQPHASAWYSIGEDDADPLPFLLHLVHALRMVNPL